MAGKEDGLDVLMREIQSNTGGATGAIGAKTAAMATAATAVPSTDDWDWSEEDKDSAYSQKEEQYNTLRDRQIAAELKHFIHDMVDCNVRYKGRRVFVFTYGLCADTCRYLCTACS
jgi:hypothetical protein